MISAGELSPARGKADFAPWHSLRYTVFWSSREVSREEMSRADIPDFIDEVIATGCSPTAVGDGYVIGDADLAPQNCEKMQTILQEIVERYGSRDHLVAEIARYLMSIGRIYQLPSIQ
jgi:hypothetical protein